MKEPRERKELVLLVRDDTQTFEQQAETIRKSTSILVTNILATIEAGQADEDTVANLARCATIVKGLMAEKRQTPDNRPPSSLSDEEIDRRLKAGAK
jgi:hypothetical protein